MSAGCARLAHLFLLLARPSPMIKDADNAREHLCTIHDRTAATAYNQNSKIISRFAKLGTLDLAEKQ